MSVPNSLQIPDIARASDVAFNFDGTIFGVLYLDGSVRIYEMQENRTFKEICLTSQTSQHTVSLAFAPSEYGTVFAYGDQNGRLFLYQRTKIAEFTLVPTFPQAKAPINAVAFAPSGLILAAAASDGFLSIIASDNKNSSWNHQRINISASSPVVAVSWSQLPEMSFIDAPGSNIPSRLVAGTADGRIVIYGCGGSTWAPEGSFLDTTLQVLNCAAWRPLPGFSRTEIAVCGTDRSNGGGNVMLWTRENNQWSSVTICQCKEIPMSVKWSTCGFILGIGSGQTSIEFYRELRPGVWKNMAEEI